MNGKILFFIFLICLSSSTAYCQNNSLKVEISTPKDLMTDFFKESHGGFWVSTRIRNVSQEDQKIHYWSCGYENSWSSSHQDIVIQGRPCLKNFVAEKILKPNEEFVRDDLLVSISPKAKVGEITFRLGFDPDIALEPSLERDAAKAPRPIWSNLITVKIIPEMLEFLSGGFPGLEAKAISQKGCVHGFGGWIEPPQDEKQEIACDEENLKQFKVFLGRCHISKSDEYDLDKDGCVTCRDYSMWKQNIKKLYELHKRSTDGNGQTLIFEPCDKKTFKE